jgi:hypothetical protein
MAIRQEPEPEICRSGMPGLNTQPQQTRLEFSRRSTPWPATWEPAPVQLAVVMFSGHGTVIRNQFYLVPYRADSSPPVRLEGSAIPAQQPVPRRNPGACPAWPGPGPTRRLPLAQPDRRPIEHAAGRGNRCGLSHLTVLTSSTAGTVSRETSGGARRLHQSLAGGRHHLFIYESRSGRRARGTPRNTGGLLAARVP